MVQQQRQSLKVLMGNEVAPRKDFIATADMDRRSESTLN
jgi:DNA gyrase/topoisomerase IV subunit B